MKYLDPKFSTPANSRAYVDGWERVLGEEERDCSACHGGVPGCDCALPTYAGLECTRHEKVTEGDLGQAPVPTAEKEESTEAP